MIYYNKWTGEYCSNRADIEQTTELQKRLAARAANSEKRAAFFVALVASNGQSEFTARCKAVQKAGGDLRSVYLETCAKLGVEPAGIDEAIE